MADGTTIRTGSGTSDGVVGGSVLVEAQGGGDILLSSIDASDADGAGNVALVADNDILDNTAAETANVSAASVLLVADDDNVLVGALNIHDLFREGLM